MIDTTTIFESLGMSSTSKGDSSLRVRDVVGEAMVQTALAEAFCVLETSLIQGPFVTGTTAHHRSAVAYQMDG
jgi:hypothetical protein